MTFQNSNGAGFCNCVIALIEQRDIEQTFKVNFLKSKLKALGSCFRQSCDPLAFRFCPKLR
jgi:hypothetical protein